MGNITYNYFKIINKDGEVYGVGATEKGSDNEVKFIEGLFNLGCKVIKITKQEYEDYDEGDEMSNF
jgi:hypothetical protein